MLIETDYLNYPPIRNNLTSASLLSIIIETDYNLVGYESHDRAARLSVKALAGPCRTEPTIVTGVGIRRITIFGTGFYSLIKSEVNIDEL